MPTKPWEIGNYDINNWPESIQQEYAAISKPKEQYAIGLAQAYARQRSAALANSI